MHGTVLIYSSHSRSNWIHNDFIVQRALSGWADKRVLFLPMSEADRGAQQFGWDQFRWFFDQYAGYGLEYFPFFWSEDLSKHDVDQLWHLLWTSEVVILGGGYSSAGMERYKQLGERYDGEWGKFGRLLHERMARGLLNVGFSAGADQMSQYLFRKSYRLPGNNDGFGCARNVMVALHHEAYDNGRLWNAANQNPHCLVFGLANDSGLYLDQGVLPSGNHWQVIEFVIDKSWDDPGDGFHIKTRQGALIEHVYSDGRHWSFGGGDRLVRIQSPDNRFHEIFFTSHGQLIHYWSQQPSPYHSRIEDVLASY